MTPEVAQERADSWNHTAGVRHCQTCRCGVSRPVQRKAGGIKRTSADARFSKTIRERDHFTCQRCGAVHDPSSQGLHCAHMFSRRIKATRLDPDNACALCFGCHQYLDSHPLQKVEFFRTRLGDERFDALEAYAKAKRNWVVKGSGDR